MSNQPVANPTPTAGMTGAPGQDQITAAVPAGVYPADQAAPTPQGQVGYPGQFPGEQPPLAAQEGPGDIEPAPPGVVADAGNDDKQETSVAAAVAMAEARNAELQTDLIGQGSTVGDLMALPNVPSDTGKMTGGSGGPVY